MTTTATTDPAPTGPINTIEGLEHLAGASSRSTAVAAATAPRARAVVYLRVSTPRQMQTAADLDEDGNSIATQREWTRDKATAMGAQIVAEFVEPGQSAQTIAKRPEFQKLLAYVDDHPEVTHVIIYMRSRVFRNFTDAAVVKRELLSKGVKLVSAKEQFGDGYMGDAMEAITDIMNEVQVRQSGEDIAVKMAHKVTQGGSVGRAKLGYLNVRKDVGGALVNTIDVDETRASLVTWLFEEYATGNHSISQLCALAEEHGLTSRPSRKRPERPLSRSRLAQMLRDPYYTGVIRYKGKLHAGRHRAIVSKETFLAVQDVLDQRNRLGDRDRIHFHYLRGLLHCAFCAGEGRTSRLIYSQSSGNGGMYEYYVCTAKMRGFCSMPAIRVELVEYEVAKVVAAERIPARDLERTQVIIADTIGDLMKAEKAAKQRLRQHMARLADQESRLIELAAGGAVDIPALRDKLEKIGFEKQAAEERLTQTEDRLAYGAEKATRYIDLLRDPGALYLSATNAIRRDLLGAFFTHLTVEIIDATPSFAGERTVPNVAIRQLQALTHQNAPDISVEGADSAGSSVHLSTGLNNNTMAGVPGLEPRTTEPETAVLPITPYPKALSRNSCRGTSLREMPG